MASLIIGVISLPFSCITCFGILSLPLSSVGLLLGGISLAAAWYRGERRMDVPIAGVVINLVTLGFAVTWMIGRSAPDHSRPQPAVQGTPRSAPKKRLPSKAEKKPGPAETEHP
jgi:hypothetical protein